MIDDVRVINTGAEFCMLIFELCVPTFAFYVLKFEFYRLFFDWRERIFWLKRALALIEERIVELKIESWKLKVAHNERSKFNDPEVNSIN